MANYIRWLRSKVGHEKVILAFAGGCLFDECGRVLLQKRSDSCMWGFPGGAIEIALILGRDETLRRLNLAGR